MSKSGREVKSFEKLVSCFATRNKALFIRDSETSMKDDRLCSFTPRPQSSHVESLTSRVPAREKDVLSAHGFSFQSIVEETKCSKLYKVMDRRNGKSKAVRVHSIENAAFVSPLYVTAIKNEIGILSHIRHENIIRMYVNFQYYSKHYVVVDYMEKGSLADYMKEHRLFPSPEERKSIFQQMLSALKYCLENNLVHHDLKLKNILLDKNNNIKLRGFGWCVPWATERGDVELCTDFDLDLDYVAPEVLAQEPYDPRPVDVWALGVILYTLLCFEMPFGSISSNTNRLLRYQKSRKLRKRIAKKAPPEEWPCIQVILDMLEPDVTKRTSISSMFSCEWLCEEKSICDNKKTKSTEAETSEGDLGGMFKE